MSDFSLDSSSVVLVVLGGVISAIGGFLAQWFKMRLERKQEIECIKISLIDELGELRSIMGNMLDTQETAHSLPKVYLDNLSKNMDSFVHYKKRLFLIKDKEVRKRISDFYKKLESTITSALSVVGTLDESNSSQMTKTAKVAADFNNMKSLSEGLESALQGYNLKLFYFF